MSVEVCNTATFQKNYSFPQLKEIPFVVVNIWLEETNFQDS